MADPKLTVLLLFGGRSAEHEISLLSARFIAESLDPARYSTVLAGIDRDGRWRLQDRERLLRQPADPRRVSLDPARPEVWLLPRPEADGTHLLHVAGGEPIAVDVAFPIVHGVTGEDGVLQGHLELSQIPYVGAGVLGSAVGMDKDVMKRLLRDAGLPVVPYQCVRRAAWSADRAAVLARAASLGLPVFVKPAAQGSSVGVRRATTPGELEAALDHGFEFDDKVLVEVGLARPREIECAVLGGETARASLPGEIVVKHADGFYSYAAKYLDADGAETRIPASLGEADVRRVQEIARGAFEVLECAGMARVDCFLDAEGHWYVNEINTIPGFTAISMYPKMWAASGVDAKALMDALVEDALARHAARAALRVTP